MYLSPRLYTLGMRVLYWPHFEDRYKAVARLVPHGSSVVDVCCGDSYLYRAHLRRRGVHYIGLDGSPEMVAFGRREGLDVRLWDGRQDPVPSADIVIIQGSLCHFMPSVAPLVERLRSAARQYVVVSEPIRAHEVQPNPILAGISRLMTTPVNDDGHYTGSRYTMDSFKDLAASLPGFRRFYTVPGGRDLIAVLSGCEDRDMALPPETSAQPAEADLGNLVFES
jgi:SAM-dependent methyltransferase